MNPIAVRLYCTFRIACAMCFIGHGAFGIITKKIWCNYFDVVGIGEIMAYKLMPVVGIVDIILGLVLLFYPIRIAAAWLITWGMFTALLRPLSGEPFAEFLERAGNYGAPLLLFLTCGVSAISFRSGFKRFEPSGTLTEVRWRSIVRTLQLVSFMLLFGHGYLNVMEKAGLLKQYASLGIHPPETMAMFVGSIEILGAFSLLIRPTRYIVLMFFFWKAFSETLHPAFALFEWIERAGSYAALLGLWIVLENNGLREQAYSFKKIRRLIPPLNPKPSHQPQ